MSAGRPAGGPARSADEPVRAPARALQVLHEIAISANGHTLARLVTTTGLPKTSLLSLLRALEAASYVDNVSGAYRLGAQALSLADAIQSKRRFLPIARPALKALFERTGETVQICVLASDEPAAESIEVIETRKPIRLSFPVGLRRPLYCSAVGKLLLACQPAEWIADYLRSTKLTAYTPHTQTNARRLRAELKPIGRQGWCLSHQGMFEDSSGMAAVIRDGRRAVLGAVSLVAPTYRMQRAEDSLKQAVIEAAAAISSQFGHEG